MTDGGHNRSMTKLQIPKNRMNYLLEQMQTHFDPGSLELGWDLFHKGNVGETALRNHVIEAEVGAARKFCVTADLDTFANSECNCKDGPYCKHKAALLFQLYSSFGRPELLLNQLKQAMNSRKNVRTAATARAEKKLQERAEPPTASSGVDAWHRYFDAQFHGFSLSHQAAVETFYTAAWDSLSPISDDWPEPLSKIYKLHVLWFMMRKIDRFYEQTQTSYLSYYLEKSCKSAAQGCIGQMHGILKTMKLAEVLPEKQVWRKSLDMLSDWALEAKESPVDWLDAYRSIWSKLALPEWMEAEKLRLEQAMDRLDGKPRKKDTFIVARVHFDVLQGKDTEAQAKLNELQRKDVSDFFLYLDGFKSNKEWDRMLLWLRWLLPAMPKAKQEEFRAICQYWLDTVKHLPSDEEWVKAMLELLPRTYYYYTAYLLNTGRFKQWVDLQLSHRISPLNLYAAELKAVETQSPRLLLPLYHQAVERSILEKNRTSYLTAVKLLKKLELLYSSLGESMVWQEFIHRLALKHNRLRAFQEELKKGKWIR